MPISSKIGATEALAREAANAQLGDVAGIL